MNARAQRRLMAAFAEPIIDNEPAPPPIVSNPFTVAEWISRDEESYIWYRCKILRPAINMIRQKLSWCGETKGDRIPAEEWLPAAEKEAAILRRWKPTKNRQKYRDYFLHKLRESIRKFYETLIAEGELNNLRSGRSPSGLADYCSANINRQISLYKFSERKRLYRCWFSSVLDDRGFRPHPVYPYYNGGGMRKRRSRGSLRK